jgi:N-acyl-D-amino-acid deacylase
MSRTLWTLEYSSSDALGSQKRQFDILAGLSQTRGLINTHHPGEKSMSHDLVIRNGLIVDGTGSTPYEGDVAISGDAIAALGKVDAPGKQEIDAEGHAITPGFVDLHTHLDAQVGWDPQLTPISWHGVTTALMGNCGVTFAPVKDSGKEFLAEMMESVEDIPRNAIMTGLPWDWNTYGEYLNSIEKLGPAINLCGLVGHCATRFYVMGKRAMDESPNEDEIKQIAALVGQSVKDGAVGFSSNRLPGHTLPDGRSIPGTFAKEEELLAISRSVGNEGGFLQFVLNYGKLPEEMSLLKSQLVAAGTRLLFSAPWNPGEEEGTTGYQSAISEMKDSGLDITGLTLPRSGGFVSGIKTDMMFQSPAWRDLRKLDFDGRLAALRDSEMRNKLIDEVKQQPQIEKYTQSFYWLGSEDRPTYMKGREESLTAMAKAAGEHPVETWIRVMLETNGEGLFHMRFFNQNLEALKSFLKTDWVLPGLGDAGAHVSQIMDTGWPSFLLSYWHRDQGLFSLEEAVQLMTSAQMRVLGFADRGSLAVGKKADINVIDIGRIAERQPELVHDFPAGAPRLIQRARGYRNTIVNGQVILENDELTGGRSGSVLRNPASA